MWILQIREQKHERVNVSLYQGSSVNPHIWSLLHYVFYYAVMSSLNKLEETLILEDHWGNFANVHVKGQDWT